MKKRYINEKIFGPVGSSSGYFLLIVGIYLIYKSPIGLEVGITLSFIGAFLGFSYTSTVIDYDKKRVKFLNNIFGIIPIGNWIVVDNEMNIRLKKSNKVWRAYSRGNRSTDISDKTYVLTLNNSKGKEIMELMRENNLEVIESKANEIANVFEIKYI